MPSVFISFCLPVLLLPPPVFYPLTPADVFSEVIFLEKNRGKEKAELADL